MALAIALDELFDLGADHYKKRKAEIESVTLDDTKRIANQYFHQPGSVEVIVAPPKN
jgi:zinc protease